MDKNSYIIQRDRGFIQSSDGRIVKIDHIDKDVLVFQAAFKVEKILADLIREDNPDILFSERSRIARLGVQLQCKLPLSEGLIDNELILQFEAMSVITGYPNIDILKSFFIPGLRIGRFVFCDPGCLLSSDEVLSAINRGAIKLPASTCISNKGEIVISPHNIKCKIDNDLDEKTLSRILFREDGREILNQYQKMEKFPFLIIPPHEGIITACSMYLSDHYVVLNSGSILGKHIASTVLDPIKTRGVHIYLELYNSGKYPIVNPLITAKIYRVNRESKSKAANTIKKVENFFSFSDMISLENRMQKKQSTCHIVDRPIILLDDSKDLIEKQIIEINGPDDSCDIPKTTCALARRDFTAQSDCPHVYGTSSIDKYNGKSPLILVLEYFPNLIEHYDIISHARKEKIKAIYFFKPSYEHGPFLSERDHLRIQEYETLGVNVFWVSELNNSVMLNVIRDGKSYFVKPEKIPEFNHCMLFAFYGSNMELSEQGTQRLKFLMSELKNFWGKNIGIVTGGGSGVMDAANTIAHNLGILSGANFLEITDQSMSTDIDFCQVFQATCRHSRQKWFEVTSFPIFNVGGLGTLEEIGITLCNMKLSISDPVPIIFFDTEGDGSYWTGVRNQILDMIELGRTPDWVKDYLVITNDPGEVINAYREKLHLL